MNTLPTTKTLSKIIFAKYESNANDTYIAYDEVQHKIDKYEYISKDKYIAKEENRV